MQFGFLDKIIFTDKDEGITGSSNKDPLGLQPIWSYYGSRVIKFLTTRSTDIYGFREVLLCISICNKLFESIDVKRKNEHNFYNDLILIFEQLFIYSAYDNGKTEEILGINKARRNYISYEQNSLISISHPLLVNEISSGYYGSYKMPLISMGIIDKNNYLKINLKVEELYDVKHYNKIFKEFKKFVFLPENDKIYGMFGAKNEIFEAVYGEFRESEKEFWAEAFKIVETNKNNLMSVCYQQINLNTDENYDCYLQKLLQKEELSEDDKKKVSDILYLEPFLRCLEYVFYKALASQNIVNLLDAKEIKIFTDCYNKFKVVEIPTNEQQSEVNFRLKSIKDKCNPANDDFIKNIVDYHKSICDKNNNLVWIEHKGNGETQINYHYDVDIGNMYEYINSWGRNYYIKALRNIKKGLENG